MKFFNIFIPKASASGIIYLIHFVQGGTNMSASIGIFYFSGTGNTEAVANLISEEFRQKGASVETVKIEDVVGGKAPGETARYDMVGIGYPIHALNAPKIVYRFIRKLPAANRMNTFIFKSPGDPFLWGGATTMIRDRLKRKGYDVTYERIFVMPSNVAIRYDDALIKQLYNATARKARVMAGEVLSDVRKFQRNSLPLRLLTRAFSSAESLGCCFFGRSLRASKACARCGTCAKNCPTGNISMTERKVKFGWRCVFCMRCMYACPKKAISPLVARFAILEDWYDLGKIAADESILGNYLSKDTRGYYKPMYDYIVED